ncbi:MAG: FAD-dependent thymidylate synthase [Lentisphaerae bacterium]|nr:FAD-dependent thymidylate synthase [Lentisphaerota bacterium]
MKVTQVSLRPTEAAAAAGAPALTPELLAATGARYSRNNEGLSDILAKIDPANLDKSVDAIFRMIDYGHQSIADMAPVAMFLDGISQWLAFYVWNLSPAASGQESSTRYIQMNVDAVPDPALLGIPSAHQGEWHRTVTACFATYQAALERWQGLADAHPEVMRIPRDLLEDTASASQKKVARLRRNYAFDRARYFLPFASATNVMMLMSARGWVQLCQHLCAHPLPEANALGDAIRGQLALCTPRLIKHASAKASMRGGIAVAFDALRCRAGMGLPATLAPFAADSAAPPTAHVTVTPPEGCTGARYAADLSLHDNRYAWIGDGLRRTAVRFAWEAVTLAEIRDLNRHRTGNRHCEVIPVGFYAALDELPAQADADTAAALRRLSDVGRAATARAHALLAAGDPSYVYWLPMGAQCFFEHLTTADKFVYEAELRTGQGAHYRYARHLHDALAIWYTQFPETRNLILEGTAEPE